MSLFRPSALRNASLICLATIPTLFGCGGDGGGNGGSDVTGVTEALASFEVAVEGDPTVWGGFTLNVTAVGDQGTKPFRSFSGPVSLGVSNGTIEPGSVSLMSGSGSTHVRTTEDGNLTVTASAQGKSGSVSAQVGEIGGKIAFCAVLEGGADLWVLSETSPDPVRLTNHNREECWATFNHTAWSPDGSKLAYRLRAEGNDEIFVVNADGTGDTNLTNNPAWDDIPSWSPDGSKIVFASDRDGDKEIFVMNADGSGLTQLTENTVNDYDPAWSPDRSKIAWSHRTQGGQGNEGVSVMNADGTGQVQVTTGNHGRLRWSPDGSKIAYVDWPLGAGALFVVNPDGTGPTLLREGHYFGEHEWSPDGSLLLLCDQTNGTPLHELFLVNADGSGSRQLTNGPGANRVGSWSPDGKWVAAETGTPPGISIVNVEGSVVMNLVEFYSEFAVPAWSPAG